MVYLTMDEKMDYLENNLITIKHSPFSHFIQEHKKLGVYTEL